MMKILQLDMEDEPKNYEVTGGVSQGLVLGHLLWNITYYGLLKPNVPRSGFF